MKEAYGTTSPSSAKDPEIAHESNRCLAWPSCNSLCALVTPTHTCLQAHASSAKSSARSLEEGFSMSPRSSQKEAACKTRTSALQSTERCSGSRTLR
eukprot:115470-Amphidinium_carterae.1